MTLNLKCKLVLLIFIFNAAFLAFGAEYPQRIISLGPSITEQIYLLGAEEQLAGCTVYCQQPEPAKNKEKIGTVIEVNVEKIVSLRPDLVIATPLSSRAAMEKLRRVGIATAEFASPRSFQELCRQFLALGRITGREQTARDIIQQAGERVAAIKGKVALMPKPQVFIQVGARPLVTANRDSFINDFIESAGGINIAKDAQTGLYSREEVLTKNPDVIIIVTMGIAGEAEREMWKKYAAVKAVKDDRIYIIDSDELCSPTPVSFGQTLEKLADILHPAAIQ